MKFENTEVIGFENATLQQGFQCVRTWKKQKGKVIQGG